MDQLIRDFIPSSYTIWKSVVILQSQSVTIDPTYQHNLKAKTSGSPYEFRLMHFIEFIDPLNLPPVPVRSNQYCSQF